MSVRGKIESNWKKEGDAFLWDITIPGNTIATIHLPSEEVKNITESGNAISSVKSVKFIKKEGKYTIYEIGSGTYNFGVFYSGESH